ncbi:Peptidase M16C associated family protein [Babesia bovis T2Bo]|uniref:Peptidase M16 inactive domain containing protein n=1 Tax=Babesia bovis TaxID=5865 RepID=A7AU33_BABBO|nr:Peptidase M16C associated family protein [Babesia bovis T2Bo]EDO06444.1 Peptidase M16C associated family protein [Babesia bovis T2Bo]|eukprot:XP_001610012.1 peptidase M16 inactive domain containing protein [Babesia bovis T2Bo]
MFIQRSISLQKQVAASLAGAGLIGCFCSQILKLPLGIEAVSVTSRYLVTQSDKHKIASILFNHAEAQVSRPISEAFLFSSNTDKRRFSTTVTTAKAYNSEMADSNNIPVWASDAFKTTHDAFEKVRHAYIPELGMAAVIYNHKPTGLNVVSLVTDISSGREMCFDIVIPTPPFNDCGCPHILEHAVLEGSKKYPSKGGFSLLLQGGFQSFVNAFTYKDRTSYLFASTNEKDFYITADFYMNAVFQPNIRHEERIFRQEAWHYKVKKYDANTKTEEDDGIVVHDRHISYGGIVYSEMQKAYSDPISRGQDYIYQTLFSNCYKYDSGGDPKHIVKLQYPELVKFYETYYGPKTATVYFYGPDDVSKRLEFIDNYMTENGITQDNSYTAIPETAKQELQLEHYKDLGAVVHGSFGASGSEEEDIILTGWLLDPQTASSGETDRVTGKYRIDLVDALGMEVLEHLLMGTSESYLYKALIKSGLGKKVVGSGLTNYFKQSNFIIGIAGIDPKQYDKANALATFDSIMNSTLLDMMNNGIKKEAIEASMNYIEFQIRELNTGTFPKGLMLVNLMQSQSQYQKDPIECLYFDRFIAELKQRVANDSKYFQKLIDTHLVNNRHKVTVHMQAMDPKEFEKVTNERVRHELVASLSHLTKAQVDNMEQEYERFKAVCDNTDDRKTLDELPSLTLKDINEKNELIPTVYYELGKAEAHEGVPMDTLGGKILCHPIESQGIIYLDMAISLENLTLDEIKYLDIFCAMLKEAGTYDKSSEDMTYHIASNLGGLTTSFSFMSHANGRRHANRDSGMGYLYIRSKSLKGKQNVMVDIIMDILKSANFDNAEKGVEIINRKINQLEAALISDGHKYAAKRLMKGLSVADYATEMASGYSFLASLKEEIQREAEKDWSTLGSKLDKIRFKLLDINNLVVNVTASPDIIKEWVESDSATLSKKIKHVFTHGDERRADINWVSEVIRGGYRQSVDEVIVAPTNVNFVGMGGPVYNEEDVNGADELLLHYLGTAYLWKHVRMSLGAYGVFCNLSACGDVIFMSYADPNYNQTLDIYKSVPKAILEAINSLSDKDLLRQKIGKISGIDKPLPVDARGFLALNRIIRGESDADRQLFREDILNATVQNFDRLRDRMERSNQWHKVCAVVNQTTANTLPDNVVQLNLNK